MTLSERWGKSPHSTANDCAEAVWRKSSHSGETNCAEVSLWYKSSHSTANDCAEVLASPDEVAFRNSRKPELVTTFTRAEWDAFILGAKDGEFDLPQVVAETQPVAPYGTDPTTEIERGRWK